MLFLIVNSAHAGAITALIVDQNVSVFALAADIAENVGDAARDVHVALPLEQMVIRVALEAALLVLSGLFASHEAYLSFGD